MQIDNPDELPYYVLEGQRPVRVRFTPLEAEDEAYINDWWYASVYFAMWQHLAQYELSRQATLKLVAAEGQDTSILGLLRMASDTSVQVMYGKLNTKSVLETAPRFRYPVQSRDYRGIGKVLVARLIAESIRHGQEGALVVSPRKIVVPFYLHLGFRRSSRNPNRFFIQQESGRQLLQSVLQEGENK